jgi:hypothetical protein
MAKFKNFEQLEEYLRTQIKEVLVDVVVPVIKEIEIEVIAKEVYAVYPNPKQYDRRGSNQGLLDIENIHHYYHEDGTLYSIRNETRKYQSNEYLAPLIEYGHFQARALGDIGYEHPRYGLAYMRPRPFTEKTFERLESTKEHVIAMKKGLENRAINVE